MIIGRVTHLEWPLSATRALRYVLKARIHLLRWSCDLTRPQRVYPRIEYEKVQNASSHYSAMNERSESFVIEFGADNDKESGLRYGVYRCVRARRKK